MNRCAQCKNGGAEAGVEESLRRKLVQLKWAGHNGRRQLTKREGAMGKIIKIKVLNISNSFLFYFVANMYGYIFQIGYMEIQPLSNYLVAGLK